MMKGISEFSIGKEGTDYQTGSRQDMGQSNSTGHGWEV